MMNRLIEVKRRGSKISGECFSDKFIDFWDDVHDWVSPFGSATDQFDFHQRQYNMILRDLAMSSDMLLLYARKANMTPVLQPDLSDYKKQISALQEQLRSLTNQTLDFQSTIIRLESRNAELKAIINRFAIFAAIGFAVATSAIGALYLSGVFRSF